jgi:hypothetical protein
MSQQQELQQQREVKQKEAELARRDAELKLHEPGPLIKTVHQMNVVRRYMNLAMQRKGAEIQQIRDSDRPRVEKTMHEAIDQYVRQVMVHLVRDHMYRRRSLEKNPLSGMTILSLPANDSKSGMMQASTKEKQERLRDEFGPGMYYFLLVFSCFEATQNKKEKKILPFDTDSCFHLRFIFVSLLAVAEFDQEEIIQAWRKQRKRRDDTFLAEGEKTLDEQSIQLLKATVCSDTMSSRYQAMLNGNSSKDTSRSIGIEALQRLVSEQRRDRYSTQIRQLPSSLVSGGGSKRKREEEEEEAVHESEGPAQQKIRLTFSQRAIEFCYDSEAVVDRVKRRAR